MTTATDFSRTRGQFHLPDGVTYLDGNSLGPMPHGAMAAATRAIEGEWAQMLIGGWNKAGWMAMPERLGNRIGRLIGAPEGTVVVGDTLSLKVYQVLASALALRPDRRVVLSDTGNFPTDLYMADGLIKMLGDGYELELVAPEDVADAIGERHGAVMLTHVDYRTGRMHDMAAITRKAHAAGAVMVWDLAHSAGAVPVDLAACGAEFAAGCTYKYLNGGPGSPAFAYCRADLCDDASIALQGWLGHAAPFAFDPHYRPAQGIARLRIGTPPVIQMAVLDAALDVWDSVSMKDIRARSLFLTDRFIAAVEAKCPDLQLVTPRDHASRGSQVSLSHEDGYAIMQALIAEGIIGDFRAPDILRFGFCPLYNTDADVDRAVDVLAQVLAEKRHEQPRFRVRHAVT